MASDPPNRFLLTTTEKADFNQYWYSAATIAALVAELEAVATKAAFLSTPSIYFSLKRGSPLREASWVMDLDEQWAKEPGYFAYDFNAPETLPPECLGAFDAVVIDPPFITEEVWAKYATTAKLLLAPGGKIILTTVAENKDMLAGMLGVAPCVFQPSIPHLVYQYNLYTNYDSERFSERNPEIPE